MNAYTFLNTFLWYTTLVQCTVVILPWNNTDINPCAKKPNGWQLLYWPKDGGCYRIFQKGYPCPDTMELIPGRNGTAKCNCPPGTAQHSRDAKCYKLYNQGPCNTNQYLGPVNKSLKSYQGQRLGACLDVEDCDKGKVFWPKEKKCYNKLTKGPCPEGLLISTKGKIGECSCDNNTMHNNYWEPGQSCHEHFLQGPCETGKIFLPSGECGCNISMVQYYPEDKKCYAIGSQGPCKEGHIYQSKSITGEEIDQMHGVCKCKDGYIRWNENDICYQPFTRGPCNNGEMLDVKYNENGSDISCIKIPCQTGELFFPGGKGCHRVGIQGPCPTGQIVLFQDYDTSIKGISYLGVCGCPNIDESNDSVYISYKKDDANCPNQNNLDKDNNSNNNDTSSIEKVCGSSQGLVLWNDQSCWQLYSQGPCKDGQWLVPDRGKGQRKGRGWRIGKCECRPGYSTTILGKNMICLLQTETLAKLFNS